MIRTPSFIVYACATALFALFQIGCGTDQRLVVVDVLASPNGSVVLAQQARQTNDGLVASSEAYFFLRAEPSPSCRTAEIPAPVRLDEEPMVCMDGDCALQVEGFNFQWSDPEPTIGEIGSIRLADGTDATVSVDSSGLRISEARGDTEVEGVFPITGAARPGGGLVFASIPTAERLALLLVDETREVREIPLGFYFTGQISLARVHVLVTGATPETETVLLHFGFGLGETVHEIRVRVASGEIRSRDFRDCP